MTKLEELKAAYDAACDAARAARDARDAYTAAIDAADVDAYQAELKKGNS